MKKRKYPFGLGIYQHPKNNYQKRINEILMAHDEKLKREHEIYLNYKYITDYIYDSWVANKKISVFLTKDRFEVYIQGEENSYKVNVNDASIAFFTNMGININC